MTLAHCLQDLPEELADCYGAAKHATILVRLEKGAVQELRVGAAPGAPGADLTVTVEYNTARRIVEGELSPSSAFFSGHFKIHPLAAIRKRPGFVAKAVLVANLILKVMRQVPTTFCTEHPRAAAAHAATGRVLQAEGGLT